MTMTDYDYAKLELMARESVGALEGRLLSKFLVHVVEPEFNVAILVTDAGTWEICGRIGAEVLGITRADSTREEGGTDGESVRRYPAFSRFEGRRIEQARTLGHAWNGHGFEITFEGLPDQTMLIQSIYSLPKAEGLEDCLRLGIGMYVSSTDGAG
jgi:hypothetical protein